MARRAVLEITCDRCDRTEVQQEDKDRPRPEFEGTCAGKKVAYEDLCRSCRKSVTNYFDRIIMAKEEKPKETAPKLGVV